MVLINSGGSPAPLTAQPELPQDPKEADDRKLPEALTKASLGYIYYLSKRTNIYTSVASAKGDTATRTTAFDFGLSHNF